MSVRITKEQFSGIVGSFYPHEGSEPKEKRRLVKLRKFAADRGREGRDVFLMHSCSFPG